MDQALSLPAAIPILAVIYVLGIVSDRMIDYLFEWIWGKGLRKVKFKESKDYHEARRKVLTQSDAMSQMIEYGRSRLRICRGWAVHSVLIAFTLVGFSWTQLTERELAIQVSVVGGSACLLLGLSSWFAWRYLNTTQYVKIHEQALFLDRLANAEKKPKNG